MADRQIARIAYNSNVFLSQDINSCFLSDQNRSKPSQYTKYKAPQKGKGQKLLEEGFQPIDFPYLDGSCYFAGANDRSIAEEFNQSYKDGIQEIEIDREIYDRDSISSPLKIAMMKKTIVKELK